MKRVALGITIVGAALALAATPAHAGTVHQEYPEQCFTYHDFPDYVVTICESSSGQFNDTITPSGDQSFVGKATSNYSVSSADFSYSESFDYKVHILVKKGDIHVDHFKYSDTSSYDFGDGTTTTCTFTENYHFANSTLRHDKPTFNCP